MLRQNAMLLMMCLAHVCADVATAIHAVDVKAGTAPNTIEVDLTKAKGVAFGIRYGWINGMCEEFTSAEDVW